MIKAGVGIQHDIEDAKEAAKLAVREAVVKLDDHKPDILFLFSSVKYDQKKLLEGAKEALGVSPHQSRATKSMREAQRAIWCGGVPIVGSSAAGEIASWASVNGAVSAMAIASDQIKFSIGCGTGVAKDSFMAGSEAARAVLAANGGKKPDLLIMIPDGITGNGAAIVEGAQSVLGKNFPIIGGSAGDDYLFKKTFEYCGDKVITDSVVGIGISGKFSYGFGIRHGWEPIGLPLTVTKADGVVLKEINNEPALKVYQDYFGKDASDLIKEPLAKMAYTYPLGIAVAGSDELLIRDPVVANEKGEITMAAAIPEGTTIRLMIGDRDAAIRAARSAAEIAREQMKGKQPRFVIMFNCMARNKLLGVRCNEENKAVQEALGMDPVRSRQGGTNWASVPMIGLYTYGEQGPLLGKKGTPAYFHNETMTMLVVGE